MIYIHVKIYKTEHIKSSFETQQTTNETCFAFVHRFGHVGVRPFQVRDGLPQHRF